VKLSTVGRLARNSVAITSALMIKRAANFVILILIARHLGVLVFGQFSLVYTLFIIFQVPAMFGLGGIIVREVAKNKPHFDRYLVNSNLIVLMASLASVGIWALLVHLLGYSSHVIKASYILGLALIPFTMSQVCEAIFQAFERMQFITYAFALTSLAKVGLIWLLLRRGYGLIEIVALLAIIQLALLVIEWYFIYRYFPRPSWVIDLSFCRKLLKVAPTFLGISVFNVIFLRLNVIVLSKLQGEVEVGLYNAVFQLSYIFMLISVSLKQAVYPVLSRTYRTNLAIFKQYAQRAIEFLISLALPLALGFFFLADRILLVYRPEFVTAAPVMRVLGWILVPMCFSRILGPVLLASNLQRKQLVITVVEVAYIFPLSVIFIQRLGLMGAGVAAVAGHVVSAVLYYTVVSRNVFPVSLPGVIWKPIVSSLFLAVFLALLGNSYGLLVIIPSAVVLYSVVLISLNLLFGGPLRSLKTWFLRGKSRLDVLGNLI